VVDRSVLASLSEHKLYLGATILTAFNDNALITYLATLVPNLDDRLKLAVVEGAVTGGGLTVIANAPNPAGQALLARSSTARSCRSGWRPARSCRRSSRSQLSGFEACCVQRARGTCRDVLVQRAWGYVPATCFVLRASCRATGTCCGTCCCNVLLQRASVLWCRNTIFHMLNVVSLALASSLTVAQAAPSQTQTQARPPLRRRPPDRSPKIRFRRWSAGSTSRDTRPPSRASRSSATVVRARIGTAPRGLDSKRS
jgi:hypothetical protein